MRSFLAAVAAAMLFGAMTGQCVMAMTSAAAPVARSALIQRVVSVCGVHGCVPVQTKRVIHHQKPGNTVPHHI